MKKPLICRLCGRQAPCLTDGLCDMCWPHVAVDWEIANVINVMHGPDVFGVVRNPKFHAAARKWLVGKTCQGCGGRERLQVHHAEVPVHWPDGKAREMDETQWRALCMADGRYCHLILGHAGDFAALNPHCDEDSRLLLHRREERTYALCDQTK